MKPDTLKKFVKSHAVRNPDRFPRRGKKLKEINSEDGPSKIGMGRIQEHSCHKDRNFAVMKRFLNKHRGQSWDDVYSEICETADCRSFTGHEFRESLNYVVDQHCTIDKDGKIIDSHGHPLGSVIGRRGQFFVHPETKTLEYVNGRKNFWREKTPVTVFEMNGILFHKHEDIWWRVQMKEVPEKKSPIFGYMYQDFNSGVYSDAFGLYSCLEKSVNSKTFDYRLISPSYVLRAKYGVGPNGRQWYCASKQSANHREIAALKKKHKL